MGSGGLQGWRDRGHSDGFFVLLPSQGKEGQRRLKEKDGARTPNKEYLEKSNLKPRGGAGERWGGVDFHSFGEEGGDRKSKQKPRPPTLGTLLHPWRAFEPGLLHL